MSSKQSIKGTSFQLPDMLADWPWPRRLNAHYAEVKQTSGAWLESFGAFSPKEQAAFNKCDFSRLAALGYPLANKDQLRTACDLMNTFFVFDEYSDVADEKTTQTYADMIMDALRNPHKPRHAGESPLGEITRQFWERAINTNPTPATANGRPAWQRRFVQTTATYCQSVVQQAAERSARKLHDVESYFEMRRENAGVKPCFALVLLERDVDLPDDVLDHPAIVELELWAVDMVILCNDIYSYNVEQARGDDGHNIVSIIMRQFGVDLQGSMDWISAYQQKLVDQFLEGRERLPAWDTEIDAQVKRYVDGVGNWVRGHDAWSFESQRYFGPGGLEIQQHREVFLLPPRKAQSEDATSAQVRVTAPSYGIFGGYGRRAYLYVSAFVLTTFWLVRG